MKHFKYLTLFCLILLCNFNSNAQNNKSTGDVDGQLFYLLRSFVPTYYTRNYDLSLELVDKIIQLERVHGDEYNFIKGNIYLKKKDSTLALETYKNGCERFPEFPYNYAGIGYILLGKRDKESLNYFIKAKDKLSVFKIAIHSQQDKLNSVFDYKSFNAHIYDGLASSHMYYKNYDSAYYYFDKAFNVSQNSYYLVRKAECMYLKQDMIQAEKLATSALQMTNNNVLAMYVKSSAMFYNGKKDKCIKYWNETITYTEAYIKPIRSIMLGKNDTITEQKMKLYYRYKAYIYYERAFYNILTNNYSTAKSDLEIAFKNDSLNVYTGNSSADFISNEMILLDSARLAIKYLAEGKHNLASTALNIVITKGKIFNKHYEMLTHTYVYGKYNGFIGTHESSMYGTNTDLVKAEKYDYTIDYKEKLNTLKLRNNP